MFFYLIISDVDTKYPLENSPERLQIGRFQSSDDEEKLFALIHKHLTNLICKQWEGTAYEMFVVNTAKKAQQKKALKNQQRIPAFIAE
jgi:hypothetical protein